MTTHHLPPRRPLIVILGSTGTGKSNLAIQLAEALTHTPHTTHPSGAEIINADAMQLYRGLPIITNKVSPAEQRGIPHHLLDHIGLEEEPWTVQRYVREADEMIRDIWSRGKVPVVVGGTGYYVYGLLLRNALVQGDEGDEGLQNGRAGKDEGETWDILQATTEEMYMKLAEVDPEMARRWHPNDRRKIQRSLEIWLKSGRKASEVYEEQRRVSERDQDDEGVVWSREELLRYDPVILWLEAESQTLKNRLDRRVDSMVENGLLSEAEEMAEFEQRQSSRGIALDKSKGIWVSIGFKEIKPLVEIIHNKEAREKDKEATKAACIEAVKAGTRQYAKRQNRFIRLRLAHGLANARASQKLFLLDCSSLEHWQRDVFVPALQIVNGFLQGEELPDPSSLSALAESTFASMQSTNEVVDRGSKRCEICQKVLMTDGEWTKHLNSRGHKKVLQGIRKRELNQARRQGRPDGVIEPV